MFLLNDDIMNEYYVTFSSFVYLILLNAIWEILNMKKNKEGDLKA